MLENWSVFVKAFVLARLGCSGAQAGKRYGLVAYGSEPAMTRIVSRKFEIAPRNTK
jgi:hypothetical protein